MAAATVDKKITFLHMKRSERQ